MYFSTDIENAAGMVCNSLETDSTWEDVLEALGWVIEEAFDDVLDQLVEWDISGAQRARRMSPRE